MSVAARSMADPFAEHTSIMKGLYHEYQKRDELEGVALVEALIQEASNMAQMRQNSIQGLIRDLSSSVNELEVLSQYPEPEGMHTRRAAALQAGAQKSSSNAEEYRQQLRQLEQQREALGARIQAAADRKAGMDKAVTAEEPVLRHQLSLFAHISKVTWRLDREDRVAGTVSCPKSGDLKPFDVDPRGMDSFALVNSLWDMV